MFNILFKTNPEEFENRGVNIKLQDVIDEKKNRTSQDSLIGLKKKPEGKN